jgi:hypothetical protein
MAQLISAFSWRYTRVDLPQFVPKWFNRSKRFLPQDRHDFGEQLFDWVQIRAVGRDVNQRCAHRFDWVTPQSTLLIIASILAKTGLSWIGLTVLPQFDHWRL